MTPEMIELEFAHIALDKRLKSSNTEQYDDPDFDEYDKETEEHDSKLSDDELPKYKGITLEDNDDWEDVD